MSNLRATGMTPTQKRLEVILDLHGVQTYFLSWIGGARPKGKIDAIIRDIQASNAEAAEDEC